MDAGIALAEQSEARDVEVKLRSLAATLANVRVRDGLSEDGGVLMHGPTFMANALACSVAAASIELLLGGDWQGRIRSLEAQLERELLPLASHEAVADVRVLGAIGVVQARAPVDVAALQARFVEQGVWIRPFGDIVYLTPAFTIVQSRLEAVAASAPDDIWAVGYRPGGALLMHWKQQICRHADNESLLGIDTRKSRLDRTAVLSNIENIGCA